MIGSRQDPANGQDRFAEGRGTTTLKRLWREEEAQDLTEYALLLVLLSLAAVAFLGELADAIGNVFSNAAANLTAAAP